jgi:gas vesicle protein
MSTEKVVLGVLAGAGVGVLMGILFAPEKGSVTRKRISRIAEDEVDALKDKMNDFIDLFGQKFDNVKDELSDFVETTKQKVETEVKQTKS